MGILEKGSEIRLIIDETRGGLCSEPCDYDAAEKNIKWFIDNAGCDEISKMGERSHDNLIKNLTRDVSVSKYADAILNLADRG